MTTYFTTQLSPSECTQLAETILTSGQDLVVNCWGDPDADLLTVALDERTIRYLESRPASADWCVAETADGLPALWASGAPYPLEIIPNV